MAMKLRSMELCNVLSFERIRMDNFRNLTIFVGPNNSGKTNIIRLVKLVQRAIVDRPAVYNILRDYAKNPESDLCYAKLTIELNDEEIEDIMSVLRVLLSHMFSGLRLAYCVIASAFEEEFNKIEKKYDVSRNFIDSLIDSLARKLREDILDTLENIFRDAFRNIVIFLRFNPKVRPGLFLGLVIRINDKEFMLFEDKIAPDEKYATDDFREIFLSLCHELIDEDARILIKDMILKKSYDSISNIRLEVKKVFLKSLEGRGWRNLGISSDELFKKAQHALSKLAEKYLYIDSDKYYAMSEIILRIIASKMLFLDEVRGAFQKTYNLKDLKRRSIVEFSHENLPRLLFYLKNSEYKHYRDIYDDVREKFRNLIGLDFDICIMEPSSETEHIRLDIRVIDPSGREYSIDFTGAGVRELLSILTAINLLENFVVFLDEPALHLHPCLQTQLLDIFKQSKAQIFMATHSPYLVSIENLDNIFRLYRDSEGTHIVPLKDLGTESDFEKMKKDLEQIPELKVTLFAKKVLITEGFHEYYVVKRIIRPDYLDIPLINAGGDTRLLRLMRFLDKIRVDYAILCDSKAAERLSGNNKLISHTGEDMKNLMQRVLDNVRKELDALKKGEKTEDKKQREEILTNIKNGLEKYVLGKNTDVLIELIDKFGQIIKDFEPLKSWIDKINDFLK